jgi:hypothetical protein
MVRTQVCHAACFHGPVFVDWWVLVGRRHQLVQSLPSFIVIVLISTSTVSTLLVYRQHFTLNLIGVQGQQSAEQQQCIYRNTFYALKSVMQPAFMDLISSISGFFVGRRHQLVKSLLCFTVNVLISTCSRWMFIPPPSAFAFKGFSTKHDETSEKPFTPPHTPSLS